MAIRDCHIEESDDPELDAALLARIDEARRADPEGESMDWDDFLGSLGEDPDE